MWEHNSQSFDKEEKWELHSIEKLSLWDLKVGNAISMFAFHLAPLSGNWYLHWLWTSLWNLMSYWIDSIFADSVILTNVATPTFPYLTAFQYITIKNDNFMLW